ncbi:MAG: DUF5320 family protein [Deltaproteobacteria bacterium]|nr:DUF5320 family protein [Deltaproteobacteria bacterium]
MKIAISSGAPFGTRGFGRGRGMGIGRGMGRRYIPQPQAAPAGELEELKRRKDELREQISRIEKRIKELEKNL